MDGFVTVVPREKDSPLPGVMNKEARSWANGDGTLWGAEVSAAVPLPGRLFAVPRESGADHEARSTRVVPIREMAARPIAAIGRGSWLRRGQRGSVPSAPCG